MRIPIGWLSSVGALAVCLSAGCRQAPPPAPLSDVVVAACTALPRTPDAPVWDGTPEHVAKLIAQDLVEPRLLKLSTAEVRVRALSDGRRLAFRLAWADPTKDDLGGAARFTDACAVQLPQVVAATVPAPQMGELGRGVEIVLWNAAWQAVVDGRGDSIRDIYPNAAVDHYPFEATSLPSGSAPQREMAGRYAPARAVGNTMAGPRDTPVQDLIAEGPGTLAPKPDGNSTGAGRRTTSGWSVVITRDLPKGLSPQNGSQVAFAVWEGGRQEVGARKMRTAWIPLVFEVQP
ncbi:MAG: ethylbenzene dehydrogenase-related protein [Thermoguttaceae bacterium]|jgi:DMSO reductase family type II enzyme heme b subunit